MIKKIDLIFKKLQVTSLTLEQCQVILNKNPLDTLLILRALSNKKALRVQGNFVVKAR